MDSQRKICLFNGCRKALGDRTIRCSLIFHKRYSTRAKGPFKRVAMVSASLLQHCPCAFVSEALIHIFHTDKKEAFYWSPTESSQSFFPLSHHSVYMCVCEHACNMHKENKFRVTQYLLCSPANEHPPLLSWVLFARGIAALMCMMFLCCITPRFSFSSAAFLTDFDGPC